MSGRYYYCKVTATVGSSTATATSTPVLLTVKPANYSILNSGKTTYYNTIDSAILAAKSGGGDSGGGTIKVLNTLTDNQKAIIDKTITIDTNGKTLTRNQSIITTGGTLTIKGNGTIYCSSSETDTPTIYCQGGSLVTSGSSSSNKLLLKSNANTVKTTNVAGNITLTNTYVYSVKGCPIWISGSGTLKTSNTFIYTPTYKCTIYVAQESTKTLTFTGQTRIGNGSQNDPGIDNDGTVFPTIKDWGSGTMNIQDTTWIMAGPYAKHGIWMGGKRTVNLSGESTVYNNSTDGVCFYLSTSGITLNFNTIGNFRTRGSYVIYSGKNSATLKITKGKFTSYNSNGYMFYIGGKILTNYKVAYESDSNNFRYMSSYDNPYTNLVVKGGYYLEIGI